MVVILRQYFDKYTIGDLYFFDKLLAKTLERPWLNNKKNVSCIPEGNYLVTKEPPIPEGDHLGRKKRDYWHFRIHNVKGRSGILIHRITYVKDLAGCIGVGSGFKDLNKDGIPDMIESSKTLQKLVDTLPDKFVLSILKK